MAAGAGMNDSCLPAAAFVPDAGRKVNFSIYAEFGSLQKERVLQQAGQLQCTYLTNSVTMVTSPTHPSIFRACANN